MIDAAPVRSDTPYGNGLQTRTLEVFVDMNLVDQRLKARCSTEQLELPDLEDPLAHLHGRYRSVRDLGDDG